MLVAAQLLTPASATFRLTHGAGARVAMAQGERPAAGVITTYAGTRPMPQMAAGPEQLDAPEAVVVAPDGALFIVDTGNNRVLRLGADGVPQVVAGASRGGSRGEGTSALEARLSLPSGAAVGPDGALYIADFGNHRVRKVTADGLIVTVAGNGESGAAGDGGPATAAQLQNPEGVAFTPDGALLIADTGNHRIRRVGLDGAISTLAGAGEPGFGGDGGPATAALLNAAEAIAVGPDGTLYVADTGNHRIRGIGADGVIRTVAGSGQPGFDGDGGPATAAALLGPSGVAVGADGSIFIGDWGNERVRKVGPDGAITTVAGTGAPSRGASGSAALPGDARPATSISIETPEGVALAPDGTLYVADTGNGRILRVTPAGMATTVAGKDPGTPPQEGVPALSSVLGSPAAVAAAPDGTLYVAATQDSRVWRITPAGILSTLAGTGNARFSGDGGRATQADLNYPEGVAVGRDGAVYIADTGNHRIRRVTPDGVITSVAGALLPGFTGDGGPASRARLQDPTGVAVGPDGTVYIADTGNHRIRRVTPDGAIATIAGTGEDAFFGDGGPATQAMLDSPIGIVVAPDGSLYVADSGNERVRRIAPDGAISTVAGTGTPGYRGDGGPAVAARLSGVRGLAAGFDGSLFVSETLNDVVRRIAPDGRISTIAGGGSTGFSGDSGPATEAELSSPSGLALGPDGSLFIADRDNNVVRRIQDASRPSLQGASPPAVATPPGAPTAVAQATPTRPPAAPPPTTPTATRAPQM